jgi:hypothetical protein
MLAFQFSDVTLLSVTDNELTFADAQGVSRHIDLRSCAENWIGEHHIPNDVIESNAQVGDWYRHCVGDRNILAAPSYFEFYTLPHLRFEFDRKEDFFEFRQLLDARGWWTHDQT